MPAKLLMRILLMGVVSSLLTVAIAESTVSKDSRIVGGYEVSVAKVGHQISLRHKGCASCAYTHTCGGSIYAGNIIITAAHCVIRRLAENLLVVAGTNKRNGADGTVVRVQQIVAHEHYNGSNYDNDVALLFLSIDLPLNNVTIKPIALATEQPANGERAFVSGWGTTSQGGTASNVLLETEVPIVDNVRCNQAYGVGRITDSMLCAGLDNGGKDACQGDSGGPLLVHNLLAGIVSWGNGCAQAKYPGVYASVPNLKSWIENTIRKNTLSFF